MSKDKPNYYAIITADVRYDNRLSDSEKIMYAEITSLSQKNGQCWASNDYFAKLYEVSNSTISRRISKLKKLGYISVEMIYKTNSKVIEKRIIKIDNTYTQNCIGGIRNNDTTPIRKNAQENNTSKSNITSINNNPIVPSEKEQLFNEFWELYPRKINKKKSQSAYNKITKEMHDIIIDDLKKRVNTDLWKKDKGKFVMHPTTYLNGERWNDELVINKSKQVKTVSNKKELTSEQSEELQNEWKRLAEKYSDDS